MRVALAHDWLNTYRGGEAVLEAIARLLHSEEHEIAALYVMVDKGAPIAPTIDQLNKVHSILQRVPGSTRALRRWLLPLYPTAVGQLADRLARDHRAQPIDLLISTSSAAIMGLNPPEGIPHICYCHSPARYVWSQTEAYAGGRLGTLRRLGLALVGPMYRKWDRASARWVTRFVANSHHIANEISRCYERDAVVVHPPVATDRFVPPDDLIARASDAPWLVAGALEPYKRVDLAIEAARHTGHPLTVCGAGSQARALERSAPANVEFVGHVPHEELVRLYQTSSCLIFPQIEDFGITCVEAQACGCPVVARRAGGALDTVIEGETGAFFDTPTPQAIAEAAQHVPPAADDACRKNALRFNPQIFQQRMRDVINDVCDGQPVRSRASRISPT